jgi:hypothetical protein
VRFFGPQQSNEPQFCFFSESEHRDWDGWKTHYYIDASGGPILRVTCIAPEIADGKPTLVQRGDRVIPPEYNDYVFVGEVADGKLRCINDPYQISPGGSFILRRPRPRALTAKRDPNSPQR